MSSMARPREYSGKSKSFFAYVWVVFAVFSKFCSCHKASGYDGLPAELFKAGGDELIRCMHHLLCNIWSLKSMTSLSLLCPVLKNGDVTICSNYRSISLLTIPYRILSSVLCERLKPLLNKLIGSYQCGFRPGKSTIDQIFTLRQILEKTQDKQINTFHLIVDSKSAFDTPHFQSAS